MSSKILDASHVSRVRVLYKTILRLHRGLPTELQALGDQYVKDEFKRHRNAESTFVPMFMHEWTNYAITLAQQLGKRSTNQLFGLKLSEEQLSALNDQQVGQLYELYQETQKPVNVDNPVGHNPMAADS
jgi:hypothetical protein